MRFLRQIVFVVFQQRHAFTQCQIASPTHLFNIFLLVGRCGIDSFKSFPRASEASVSMICINFFIATVYPQMRLNSATAEEARRLNSQFAAFLPAGGIVFIPFIGIIIDKLGPSIGFLILQAAYGGFLQFGIFFCLQ